MEPTTKTRPNLSKVAFWDVNIENIDFEASSLFVMNKVVNYGSWADIIEIFKYYGVDRVKREIVNGSYFKKTALSFLCTVLSLSEADFTSYQNRQDRNLVWNH